MRKLDLGTILYVVFATIFVSFLLYYSYESNWLNLKQNHLNYERVQNIQDLTLKENKIDTQQLKSEIMRQDQAGLNKLGIVSIPELGIFLPIYNKPYDNHALKVGANQLNASEQGQDINTSLGQGNLLLVAHNYANGTQMFSALQQNLKRDTPYLVNGVAYQNNWLNGKKVYVANDKAIFEYTIDRQNIIPMTDMSVKENTNDSEINILTCLEPSDNYRIVTHGRLTKQYSFDEDNQQVFSYLKQTATHRYNL